MGTGRTGTGRRQPGRTGSTRWQRLAAAFVHLYTATGSVLAFLIVLAAIDGKVETALWLGLAALVVDGTDGMMARAAQVKVHYPWFDGARMDDIVDYLTYVFAPVVLLRTAGYLPAGAAGLAVAALPLLTSCYQFCRADAKTDDHFFLGFPSYWNVLAFYAIVMHLSATAVTATIVVCAILVFVPVRYLYPSRSTVLRTPTLALTGAWLVLYGVIITGLPHPAPVLVQLSLAYVGYYAVVSVAVTLQTARKAPVLDPGPAPLPAAVPTAVPAVVPTAVPTAVLDPD